MRNESMQNFVAVVESVCSARIHSALTFQGLAILCLISERPLHLALIAKELGVTPPTVTDMADRLERLGYAVRRLVPGNRRVRLLELTQEGGEVLNKVFPATP